MTGATTGQVTFTWGGSGRTVSLVNGVATTKLPGDLAAGTYAAVASFLGTHEAAPSTSAAVTLSVTGRASHVDVDLVPRTVTEGRPAEVRGSVRSDGRFARGQVAIAVDGTVVATGTLTHGSVVVALPRDLSVGSHHVTVSYLGSSTTAPSSDTATLTVKKARGRH